MRTSFLLALLVGLSLNLASAWDSRYSLSVFNLGIDTAIYDEVARRMAEQGRIDVPPSLPPGFVVFLAGLYRLFGHEPLALKISHSVMLFLVSVLVWRFGRKAIGETEGRIAALLVAFSPLLSAYAMTVQFEVLAAFLFTGTVILLRVAQEAEGSRKRIGIAIAAGVAGGLLTVTREVFLAVCPLIYLTAVGARRSLLFIVYFLIVGSWITYASVRAGEFVPVSTKGKINLEAGNNPGANGTFNLTRFPADGSGFAIPEPKGMAFLREEPVQALRLAGRKLLYFFGLRRDGWNVPRYSSLFVYDLSLHRLPLETCQLFSRAIVPFLLGLGAVLVLWGRKHRRELAPTLGAIGIVVVTHMILMSSHRYIVPVLPFVFLVAAIPLGRIVRKVGWKVGAGVVTFLFSLSCLGRYAGGGAYSLALTELDGVQYQEQSSADGPLRYFDRRPRPIAILSDEYLPAGFLVTSVHLRSSCAQSERPFLRAAFLGSGGEILCEREFRCNDGSFDLPCYLSGARAVKLLVTSQGTEEIWLKGVSMSLSLGAEEVSGKVTEPIFAEGWSGEESWAPRVRWAIGRQSLLILPAGSTSLRFRALPFATPQELKVSSGSQVLATYSLRKGWNSLAIDLPTSGRSILTLEHSKAESPRSQGHGFDSRELAVAYSDLQFEDSGRGGN